MLLAHGVNAIPALTSLSAPLSLSSSWRSGDRWGWLLPWLPSLLVLGFDVALRGSAMRMFGARAWGAYGLAWLVGATLWGSALVLATQRRGASRQVVAAVAVVAAALLFGGQRYFFLRYGTYLNRDAIFFGVSFGDTVKRLMAAEAAEFVRACVPVALAAGALVVVVRRGAPLPARLLPIARWAVAPALLGALLLPWSFRGVQASPPDVIYLHALGGLLQAKLGRTTASEHTLPGARTPEFLPALVARPARPRNVIFVLNESVRADVVCSAYEPECPGSPQMNAALPGRLPLSQLRANDSSTTISVAVTLTGVAPNDSRDQMHRAPTLWEFGRAAGYDTAYWTSQDLRGIHSDMFVREVGARIQVAGNDIDPNCDVDLGANDELLSQRVAAQLHELREPFVAVVHYANTHFPYRVDPERSPFQPSEDTKDPDKNTDYFNYYRNSVHLQDQAIAPLLRAVRGSPVGERTVLVYTSDHGEAFREHYQLAHSLSIYDEEVHVPGWIDAPEGSLAPAERAALEGLRETPVWHIDLLPTFLDLMGLWDAPEVARFRARMPGVSLLRAWSAERVVPLTNCTAVWGCPFRNWGVMRGPLKLEARAWDPEWHCWNVLADPKERKDLGVAACGDLPSYALRFFGERPGDAR